MPQSDALRVRSTVRDPITHLELAGQVDESFDPALLLTEAKTRIVILNLKGITRLTSFGVREWTNAMRELCKRVEKVYWSECSPSIVTQLNMVANFSGTAQIVSVQARLYCELCGWETNLNIPVQQGVDVKLAETQCEQCTAVMAFDDDLNTYFAFPKQRGITGTPADASVLAFLRAQIGGNASQAPSAAEAAVRAITQASMPPQPAGPAVPRQQESYSRVRGRPSTAFSRAQPILVGIAIPAVIATAIALTWPSSDELPEEQGLIYQEHLKSERFQDAKSLVDKMVLERKISP